MAKYKMFFNPAKAIAELGLPQTPPREAFADAVAMVSPEFEILLKPSVPKEPPKVVAF